MANIVPAMIQKNPQPSPTIVLATVDLKHTLSVVDSLNATKKIINLEKWNCNNNIVKKKEIYLISKMFALLAD